MPSDQREFRGKKKEGQRYDQNYGVTNLWRYEAAFRDRAEWENLAARVPFLNGGLFDCLDDKSGKKKDNFILDGFSDREDFGCHLPNDLFFGPERTVDLSRDYGEEDKRTARSKRAKVRGLIEILSRYKFTIEENTPWSRKSPSIPSCSARSSRTSSPPTTRTPAPPPASPGSFYTPREIVSYMVDEALKSYLASQVPRCKGRRLTTSSPTRPPSRKSSRDTRDVPHRRHRPRENPRPRLRLRRLPHGRPPPACDLLQKLDPNNESLETRSPCRGPPLPRAARESGAAKDELAACDARIADIEKSFDTRYHALDFARKLYLIENCIYGVDIQPIATQIAKLRFFISLVVDQKVEPRKDDNLGVRPLPNLETRLVAADTLIPIPRPTLEQATSSAVLAQRNIASWRN